MKTTKNSYITPTLYIDRMLLETQILAGSGSSQGQVTQDDDSREAKSFDSFGDNTGGSWDDGDKDKPFGSVATN